MSWLDTIVQGILLGGLYAQFRGDFHEAVTRERGQEVAGESRRVHGPGAEAYSLAAEVMEIETDVMSDHDRASDKPLQLGPD